MRASPGDTIAAIATSLGPGGIAIVRLSGDRAIAIAGSVFRGRIALADSPSHTVHHGLIVDLAGREADEVLVTVMRSPKTYTAEDIVEIACHGGTAPARRVLEVCLEAGARLARRGEFTERAFLNGRIDLVQAEAVADIVAARTRKGLEVALGQLEGALSREIWSLRDKLLDFRAQVEALVDFPSDEIEATTMDAIAGIGRAAQADAARMLSHCDLGIAVREGITVAIVGKPNVGKSSVMNALLKRDRSIVTSVPGTTRDAIEECLHVGGVAVRLIDTAGWRTAEGPAEEAGVERAKAAAEGATLVMLVVDAASGLDDSDSAVAAALSSRRVLVVGNKIDLGRVLRAEDLSSPAGGDGGERAEKGDAGQAHGWGVVWVSAVTGEGLDRLRETLVEEALGCLPQEEPFMVSNIRHADALGQAERGIGRAVSLLVGGGAPELVAVEIQEAALALGEITGETTPEDVLARIFERFCVGK